MRRSEQIVHIVYPEILKDCAAEVPLSVDPVQFLAQKELADPYRGAPDASQSLLGSRESRGDKLMEIWKQLLLVHPSSSVVVSLLSGFGPLDGFAVSLAMVGLMLCATKEVKHEVAKAVWRRDYEPEYFFNVLGNRGMMPAGIQPEEGKKAALILREHCPERRMAWFREKALDLFGPSVAGVAAKQEPSQVKLKTKYTKRIDATTTGTYEVYTAPSKAVARAFLEKYRVSEQYFYVEVETPEGPVGKDVMGLY